MAERIAYRPMPFKSCTLASVSYHLHELHGESPATWEARMSGDTSDFRQCARIITALCQAGLHGKAHELMAPIDAALGSCPRPEAEYHEKTTDAAEDVAQAEFARWPSRDTARALLRQRARERAASLDHDREIATQWGIML